MKVLSFNPIAKVGDNELLGEVLRKHINNDAIVDMYYIGVSISVDQPEDFFYRNLWETVYLRYPLSVISFDHGYYGNHGAGQAEGVKIEEVGGGEEYAYPYYRPAPVKPVGLAPRKPDDGEHQEHHRRLVDVVPRLHRHTVKPHAVIRGRSHEVFVVKPADGSEYRRQDDAPNPLVVREIDAFLLARPAQQEEGRGSHRHAGPLPSVEPLSIHQQCPY